MVTAATGEQLQPSLLDRLVDRGRFLERATVVLRSADLAQARLSPRQLRDRLERERLRHLGEDGGAEIYQTTAVSRRWAEILRSPIAPGEAGSVRTIGDFLDVRAVARVPFEGQDVGGILGMRELRNSVLTNVQWLLNSVQLLSDDEIEDLPEVQASVLNYGIPALTGTTRGSINTDALAGQIRKAIERFEPRLREVEVTVSDDAPEQTAREIAFRIRGRCWGPDSTERMDMRTTLALDVGRFNVRGDGR
ncbi:MAG TPA: type VI secretion system baseplate subunit TssE [Candidatus Binatia bacterium]|nr:type VI secretion system baseplate subunit TssE [Candidatus Binatia bacterium]